MAARKKQNTLHIGWFVLFATFYLNLVVDGYCFISGILIVEISDEYPDYDMWQISIISGLVPTLYLLLAPPCIAINEFLGPCRIIMLASAISTGSFVMAWANGFYFLKGFYFDLFFLGFAQGISSALLYGPSIAVIPDYFPKRQRSLATGITTCGSSVGAILFGLITTPLMNEYGWRGYLVIFSCFSIQGIALALFFKDSLKPKIRKVRKDRPVRDVSYQRDLPAAVSVMSYDSDIIENRPPDNSDNIAIPPCHIMRKISEDKRRSRLDTDGSLDGSIITRDNVLLKLSDQRNIRSDSRGNMYQINVVEGIHEEDENDESSSSSSSSSSDDEEIVTAPTSPKPVSKPTTPMISRQSSKEDTLKPPPPTYQRQNSGNSGGNYRKRSPSNLSVHSFVQSMAWIVSQVAMAPQTFREVLAK